MLNILQIEEKMTKRLEPREIVRYSPSFRQTAQSLKRLGHSLEGGKIPSVANASSGLQGIDLKFPVVGKQNWF